ncbi:MAG TPA: hypothetical protein VGP46_07060, partial [Acidimicrobiales bacterium]|nr:hypothetical protein [Acidimicrobiales bacterium]
MTLQQSIVWTALPSGWVKPGVSVALSVFVAPRLSGGALLEDFDFKNWPATLAAQTGGALKFKVRFEGHPAALATTASQLPAVQDWALLFDAAKTGVDDWEFRDLSSAPLMTYSVSGVQDFVKTMYTAIGTTSPTVFPTAEEIWKYLPSNNNDRRGGPGWPNIAQATEFHQLPKGVPADTVHVPDYQPPVPVFDFHQTLGALHPYPALMRQLGIVFDLEVTLPSGLGPTPSVQVAPDWDPKLKVATIDASPWTACLLSGSAFRAKPRGPDYANGMLDLQDTARFFVTDLDTDGVADRLNLQAITMLQKGLSLDDRSNGVPATRSTGPQIIWNAWAQQPSAGPGKDLSDLFDYQKSNNATIDAYFAAHGTGPLP